MHRYELFIKYKKVQGNTLSRECICMMCNNLLLLAVIVLLHIIQMQTTKSHALAKKLDRHKQ